MEFNNGKSIFLQIADRITEKVVSGAYSPGEKIPSVREMAAEVGVNPNTIMRTYNELQSLNVIENKRGIGYFVKSEAQKIVIDKKKSNFFEQVLPEIIRQAGILDISIQEIKHHLDQISKIDHENK